MEYFSDQKVLTLIHCMPLVNCLTVKSTYTTYGHVSEKNLTSSHSLSVTCFDAICHSTDIVMNVDILESIIDKNYLTNTILFLERNPTGLLQRQLS